MWYLIKIRSKYSSPPDKSWTYDLLSRRSGLFQCCNCCLCLLNYWISRLWWLPENEINLRQTRSLKNKLWFIFGSWKKLRRRQMLPKFFLDRSFTLTAFEDLSISRPQSYENSRNWVSQTCKYKYLFASLRRFIALLRMQEDRGLIMSIKPI